MKQLFFILTFLQIGLTTISRAQDVESYMIDANEAINEMDFDNAALIYSKIIEIDPNNIEALYQRGWCENFWNKSKGFEDFKRVLELDSLHEGALHSMAEYYSFQEEYELSKEYKMKAIALNPKTASNLLTLARMANASGDFEKAIELSTEGIALDDEVQTWIILLERGEAYLMTGKHQEAITDFEKCFNDFSYGMYMCNNYEMCGDAYFALGNTNKACENWNIAVQNDDSEYDPASDEVKLKAKENCTQ